MRNLIRKYRNLSFEQRTIIITIVCLCFSTLFACGKLVIGLFTDYNLCIIGVYTLAMLLAKLECVLAVKSNRRSFKTRNTLIAVFLIVSSVIYIGFMSRMLFSVRRHREYGLTYVGLVAFISFAELGFAISGILRTKNRGLFYRNIKIINFCISLMAILTTQITILDYCSPSNTDVYNAYAGIGVGVFIIICAVYILLAPRICVTDREHNVFGLENAAANRLIDMSNPTAEILLCKSKVYGSYIYSATVQGGVVDGNIGRGKSLWKQMHVLLKILCVILSEILIFAWLIGRFIFFLRSINLPDRLGKIMTRNGFKKIG